MGDLQCFDKEKRLTDDLMITRRLVCSPTLAKKSIVTMSGKNTLVAEEALVISVLYIYISLMYYWKLCNWRGEA